jgi:hypothetical protein
MTAGAIMAGTTIVPAGTITACAAPSGVITAA